MRGLLLQLKPHLVYGPALASDGFLVILGEDIFDKAAGHRLKLRVDGTLIGVDRFFLVSPQLTGNLVHRRQGEATFVIGLLSHKHLLSY
jgi:hypothetical protein